MQIVRLQCNQIIAMVKENGIDISVSDAAIARLSSEGFDPQFGARPVRRVIQKRILNDLSKHILADDIDRNRPVTIDFRGDEFVFENRN